PSVAATQQLYHPFLSVASNPRDGGVFRTAVTPSSLSAAVRTLGLSGHRQRALKYRRGWLTNARRGRSISRSRPRECIARCMTLRSPSGAESPRDMARPAYLAAHGRPRTSEEFARTAVPARSVQGRYVCNNGEW